MTRLLRILMLLGVLAAVLVAPAAAYKVDSAPPPSGAVGTAYSFTFKAVGGSAPHKFRVDSGWIPPGLTLSDEGALAGTPTQAGTFNFYIQAIDSTGLKSEVQFSITIDSRLIITTSSLPAATRGVPYTQTIGLSGGSATSWTVSDGALPAGFTLSSGGVLSGTPTSEGSTTFTVKAANGSKSDTKQLTLQVVAPLGISIGAIPPAIVGKPFATKLAATGGVGTYTFTLTGGALPAGLAFDTASGVVAGTPGKAGRYPLQISVTASGGGSALQTVQLVVKAQLGIVTTSLPAAKVGRWYSTQIVLKGGVLPYTLTSTSTFPQGLQLDGDTGKLTGRAVRTGRYPLTIVVHDSYGGQSSRKLVLRVFR